MSKAPDGIHHRFLLRSRNHRRTSASSWADSARRSAISSSEANTRFVWDAAPAEGETPLDGFPSLFGLFLFRMAIIRIDLVN
jgi:hypothetical protein